MMVRSLQNHSPFHDRSASACDVPSPCVEGWVQSQHSIPIGSMIPPRHYLHSPHSHSHYLPPHLPLLPPPCLLVSDCRWGVGVTGEGVRVECDLVLVRMCSRRE